MITSTHINMGDLEYSNSGSHLEHEIGMRHACPYSGFHQTLMLVVCSSNMCMGYHYHEKLVKTMLVANISSCICCSFFRHSDNNFILIDYREHSSSSFLKPTTYTPITPTRLPLLTAHTSCLTTVYHRVAKRREATAQLQENRELIIEPKTLRLQRQRKR